MISQDEIDLLVRFIDWYRLQSEDRSEDYFEYMHTMMSADDLVEMFVEDWRL
jgi:hypothetical protein